MKVLRLTRLKNNIFENSEINFNFLYKIGHFSVNKHKETQK